MADNIVSGDVFIELEQNNVFIINPNKEFNEQGYAEARNIKQEDFVTYANLECNLLPRTRLLIGVDNSNDTTLIATTKINFLKPNNSNYLNTDWTLPQGEVSTNFNEINTELLGITNISYSVNNAFAPTITILLEDITGRALFESGDNSPYSVFFSNPPLPFFLTFKGYYGKAIRMTLILEKFSASFNQSNGNFNITVIFKSYQYGVLQEMTMTDLYAVPQMYLKSYNDNSATSTVSQSSPEASNPSSVGPQTTYKGYQYIQQLFSEYRNLGLIDDTMPTMTVEELVQKLDNFVINTLQNFGNENMSPLTDADNYGNILDEYRKQIVTAKGASFFEKYTDKKNFWILTEPQPDGSTKQIKLFVLKPEYKNDRKSPYNFLKNKVDEFNLKLVLNPTFGGNGKYKIKKLPLMSSLKKDTTDVVEADIVKDILLTIKAREGKANPTNTEVQVYKEELRLLFNDYNVAKAQDEQNGGADYPLFYYYEGGKGFNETLNSVQKDFSKNRENSETEITDKLVKILESNQGVGFKPTIRNVLSVLFASGEALLRLMCDVHNTAFENRNDEKRKIASKYDIQEGEDAPTYPWPQVMVGKTTTDGEKLELVYPGDPTVTTQFDGNDYSVWPETEFVDEYLRGLTTRTLPVPIETNEDNSIREVLISGFDTPTSNVPYSNLDSTSFFFELFDRIYSMSRFQNFIKSDYSNIIEFLAESDYRNMFVNIVNSSEIIDILKNYNFNSVVQFREFLQSITNNGTGKKYQNLIRGVVNADYLKSDLDSLTSFLNEDLPTVSTEVPGQPNIINYLKSKIHNSNYFGDTYPFISQDWLKSNLANSILINNFSDYNTTDKSIIYNENTRKISNYVGETTVQNFGDKTFNRPFTDFRVLNNNIVNPVDLTVFYINRESYCLTEGRVTYNDSYNGSVGKKQTTSFLNTPYFINGLMNDIDYSKQTDGGDIETYIESAYYFLNSLPLSNLREKYKKKSDIGLGDDLNYISATLKKFGSIHSLPELWVYKLGSIWYRYNYYLDNGADILSSWESFDQNTNFNNSNSYQFTLKNGSVVNINLKDTFTNSTGLEIDSINLGFYPELINKFYYFVNGVDLYTNDGTNDYIQRGIQQKIDDEDLVLINTSDSSILKPNYNGTKTLSVYTWSVLIKNKLSGNNEYVPCPSFGSTINQSESEFTNTGILSSDIYDSQEIFDGSVRLMWGLPNYGYFSNTNVDKPSPLEYTKFIYTGKTQQDTFHINSVYDSIEEIFSIFSKEELDLFSERFLEFTKPKLTSKNQLNFQKILIEILSDSYDITLENNNLVIEVQNKLNDSLINNLNSMMNYNIILKIANPSKFDLQLFNYFTKKNNLSELYVSYLTEFETYDSITPNALPNSDGTVNPNNVFDNFSLEYFELLRYVGFSSLSELNYFNPNGNYIYDFFIDNNLAFTVNNIVTFAPIIKIYATQKLLGKVNNNDEFVSYIRNIFLDMDNFSNDFSQLLFQKLRASLPTQNSQTNKSPIVGDVTPLDSYQRFKNLNDKWIATNNYKTFTLFQDLTMNDRAGRYIGDKIIVDINSVKNLLKGALDKKLEYIIRTLFLDNGFQVFVVPSYVNFYGVPTPTGNDTNEREYRGTKFSNDLFGIFTEVDYQDSRTKMVATYTQGASQYAKLNTNYNGYKDDSFDAGYQTNVLNEDQTNKKDYGLTNKIVGIAVDFGLQQQSVFTNIQVSQDIGKSTSESNRVLYETANIRNGVKSAIQSSSNFNTYLNRSYQATIECMGNAMIQPNMYFILRNVPLFAGSYLIQSVSHVITESDFKTTFIGTRQRVPEYPIDNLYTQSVKTQFLNVLKSSANKKQASKTTVNTTNQQNNDVTNTLSNYKSASPQNNCTPLDSYAGYSNKLPQEIIIDYFTLKTAFLSSNAGAVMRKAIFSIFIIESKATESQISAFDYNFAGITLDINWQGELKNFLSKNYVCLSTNNVIGTYAVFPNTVSCINFVNAKFKSSFERKINNITDKSVFAVDFARAYIENFQTTKVNDSPDIFEEFRTNNPEAYQNLISKVESAFEILRALNL